MKKPEPSVPVMFEVKQRQMLVCECYELQNLTPCLKFQCPFCHFVRNSGKYFEREDGTYSFHQLQYSHTCHLKAYNAIQELPCQNTTSFVFTDQEYKCVHPSRNPLSSFPIIFSLVDDSYVIFLIWLPLLLSVCRFQVYVPK